MFVFEKNANFLLKTSGTCVCTCDQKKTPKNVPKITQ
jgi:hypothetical protein